MHIRTPRTAPRRSDDGDAFLPDPGSGPAHMDDDLAELLSEEFIAAATSGEEQGERERNQIVPEELGGPFIQSSSEEEIADDEDETNPPDAEAEPFPRAVGGRS